MNQIFLCFKYRFEALIERSLVFQVSVSKLPLISNPKALKRLIFFSEGIYNFQKSGNETLVIAD